MGRLTQAFDYLNKPSKALGGKYQLHYYSHITITKQVKQLRWDLRHFRKDDK